jgi:hypothetical protein
VPALFTRNAPMAPELRYLAAQMPLGRVADFLADVFPLAGKPPREPFGTARSCHASALARFTRRAPMARRRFATNHPRITH